MTRELFALAQQSPPLGPGDGCRRRPHSAQVRKPAMTSLRSGVKKLR